MFTGDEFVQASLSSAEHWEQAVQPIGLKTHVSHEREEALAWFHQHRLGESLELFHLRGRLDKFRVADQQRLVDMPG